MSEATEPTPSPRAGVPRLDLRVRFADPPAHVAESGAPSSTVCPEHGEPLADRRLLEHGYQECKLCGLALIPRATLNHLRDKASLLPDVLLGASAGAGVHPSPSRGGLPRRCPVCQSRLNRHTFGGGNVRVESCEDCELVLLGRADIAAIVKEARDGIQMSDDAHAVLHHQRMLGAGNQLLAAELGLGTVVLVAVLVFLRIVLRVGFSTGILAAAAIIALGVALHLYRKWSRRKAEATAKMERLAAAEIFRQEQKAREAASPAPAADSQPRPVSSSPATPRPGKPRRCPVCRASMPAATTHCTTCDSDFG